MSRRKYSDDLDHERFIAWHRARTQARFRKEPWDLTIEDWFQLWNKKKWAQRGRARLNLCMVRMDQEQSWSVANCRIVTRLFQLRMYAKLKVERNRAQSHG